MFETQGARGIEPETFGRRGQLLSRPLTTGPAPCVTTPRVHLLVSYTEKATEARHRLDSTVHVPTAKQCRPNETKPYSNATHPRKRQNISTNGPTPSPIKSTHTRLTYTGTRPHVPSHQAGDHPVPAHTERHNPPKVGGAGLRDGGGGGISRSGEGDGGGLGFWD